MYQTNYICTLFFSQIMELCSNLKREGKGKTKDSNRVRDLCASEQHSWCHWKSLCVQRWESNTGSFWNNFHMFTDHNKFRKRKPSRLHIPDSGADFKHGETGWTFIVPFTSAADESWVSVYLRAICSLLADLVTALVKAGKGQSRILPSQQILAGSSGEEWNHSLSPSQFSF